MRSCKSWKITKSTGITTNPKKVPISCPTAAPVATERLPAAPTPVANTNGKSPTIKANEVIRIGRKRAIAALIAALERLSPIRRRCTANSTIRIAFLAKRPISIISEIWK